MAAPVHNASGDLRVRGRGGVWRAFGAGLPRRAGDSGPGDSCRGRRPGGTVTRSWSSRTRSGTSTVAWPGGGPAGGDRGDRGAPGRRGEVRICTTRSGSRRTGQATTASPRFDLHTERPVGSRRSGYGGVAGRVGRGGSGRTARRYRVPVIATSSDSPTEPCCRWQPEYAEEMAGVLAEPALYTFTGGEPPTVEALGARYERQVKGPDRPGEHWLNWVIQQRGRDSSATCRQLSLTYEAEIAWVVGTAWQGRGYAKEAAVGLVAWLEAHGVRRIVAHDPPRSRGVSSRERCGRPDPHRACCRTASTLLAEMKQAQPKLGLRQT